MASRDREPVSADTSRRAQDQDLHRDPPWRKHFQEAAREHVGLVRREFLSHFTDDELERLAGYWRRTAEARTPAAAKAVARAKGKRGGGGR